MGKLEEILAATIELHQRASEEYMLSSRVFNLEIQLRLSK
jgi:hypothetical protein